MTHLHIVPQPTTSEPDFYDRAEAAQLARDILVVKAGKYAEREVSEFAVINLAHWLLFGTEPGPEPIETPPVNVFVNDGPCQCEDCK